MNLFRNYILPPLPTPRVQFAEDSEDEESGALFVERNDILDTTLALNASGFDQTNRTESTFLSSPNDTTYNEAVSLNWLIKGSNPEIDNFLTQKLIA